MPRGRMYRQSIKAKRRTVERIARVGEERERPWHQKEQAQREREREATMARGMDGHGGHVVAIPLPLQGHIKPMLELLKRIAATPKSPRMTVVNTESCYRSIVKSNNGFDPFQIDALDIHSAHISDGLPIDFDRSLHHDEFITAMQKLIVPHLQNFIRSLHVRTTCLLADSFFSWSDRLSKTLGVPHISFWTESAAVFSIYHHWHLLVQHGHFPFPDHLKADENVIDYIPGLRALKVTDLPSYLQEADVENNIVTRVIRVAFQESRGAVCVVANVVEKLEAQTVKALKEAESNVPFICVGPLLEPKEEETSRGTSLWAEAECEAWLDRQSKGSVVYISFGSYAHVGREQLEEVAMALLKCGNPFVWVLRRDIVGSGDERELPPQFLEEVKEKDQGMIVGWCRQRSVLGHPAVGAFFTHCGWNSVLESIWEGVPMLAFPLLTDQYTNRRLVVEEWGVALDVGGAGRSDGNVRSGLVGRDEICESVQRVMKACAGVDDGYRLRRKLEWAKKALTEAQHRHSYESFDDLSRLIASFSTSVPCS